MSMSSGPSNDDSFKIDDAEELNLQKCNEIMQQLDEYTDPLQITKLQERLSNDYKDLVTEFANARLKRIEELITIVDRVSKSINKSYTKFETTLENKTPGISKRYGVEMEMPRQKRRKSSTSLENNTNNLRSSPPPSPPLLPTEIDVPIFKEAFIRISQPYVSNLENIKNKYIYQNEMIENKTYASKNIVWMQFLKQRQELKEKKISALSAELNDLEYEFKGIRRNKLRRIDELNHRKSKSSKFNSKSMHKKLSHTLSKKLETMDQIFNLTSSGLTNMVKDMKIITGLTEEEVHDDLKLMKYWGDKEDEPYRLSKQVKIKKARESVELQLKESKEKIKQLIEKQKDDEKKSKYDFMKQQEELFKSSQMSNFPLMPPSMVPNSMFPPFFMPPFMQHPFPPDSNFIPPQPLYPHADSQQQQGNDISGNSNIFPQQHPMMMPPPLPGMFFGAPSNFPISGPHPVMMQQQEQQQYQQQQQQQQQSLEAAESPRSEEQQRESPKFEESPQVQLSQSAPDHQTQLPTEQQSQQPPSNSAEENNESGTTLMGNKSVASHEHSPHRPVIKTSNSTSSRLVNPLAIGEFTTIKDIIALKDRERQKSSYKRYYTAGQN